MTQFEKLKAEINAMDIDTFIKHFITRKGGKLITMEKLKEAERIIDEVTAE